MENMRQEFVSNVSHEIQSAIDIGVHGFAQVLKSNSLSDEEAAALPGKSLKWRVNAFPGLADDLLKLTSLEAEQVKFAPRLYRLDKQVRSLILTCEPQWAEKKIEMNVALRSLSIQADEDLLRSGLAKFAAITASKFTLRAARSKVALRPPWRQSRILYYG